MNYSELVHSPSEKMPSTQFVGGIFPRKHISILSAKSGVGKTWFILKFLTDLSRGGTVMNGISYYEPKRKCFLFVGETGIELVNERQKIMYDKADDDYFFIVSRIEAARKGLVIDFSKPDGVRSAYNICKDYQPDIIVFDTLMSFRSDDENAMQNTNTMMSNLQALAENLNCALVCTHHVRKRQGGNKERVDQDELIGSSAIVRQCGIAFILTRNNKNYKLIPVKTWWKTPEAYEYRMTEENGLIVFSEPSWTEDMNLTERRMKAKSYLENLADDETVTVAEISEHFKVTKMTARKWLEMYAELVSEGSVGSGNPAVYRKKIAN